jgi:dynactin complex subunit
MVNFVQNIWSWINSNWPEIAGVLGTVDLTAAAAALFMLFKHKKAIKANTDASDTMVAKADDLTDAATKLTDATKATETLTGEIATLKEDVANERTEVAELNKKLDSVLDVMEIVYSTLRDENLRTAVNSIIVHAKYNAVETKAELERHVTELQETLTKQAEEFKAQTQETLEEVKNIGTKKKQTKNVSTRY